MKLLTTLFIFTFSFPCAYSQIDWQSYEDPDKTFKRLSIDPVFTLNTNYNGQFTVPHCDLRSTTNYKYLKMDTLSILSITSNNRFSLGVNKKRCQ